MADTTRTYLLSWNVLLLGTYDESGLSECSIHGSFIDYFEEGSKVEILDPVGYVLGGDYSVSHGVGDRDSENYSLALGWRKPSYRRRLVRIHKAINPTAQILGSASERYGLQCS